MTQRKTFWLSQEDHSFLEELAEADELKLTTAGRKIFRFLRKHNITSLVELEREFQLTRKV